MSSRNRSLARWLGAVVLSALTTHGFAAAAMPDGFARYFSGATSSGACAGIAVGFVDGDAQQTWFYGTPAPDADSAFEIGAVTDVFTGLLLAQAVLAGKVHLDDAVGKVVPDLVPDGAFGARTTLDALATQRSGFASTPANLFPPSGGDPYAAFSEPDLRRYLVDLAQPPATRAAPAYSVLNAGTLGWALGHAYGSSLADALHEHVLKPLGLEHTTFDDPPDLLQGHAFGLPVPHWHYAVLGGAAGLRSTLGDLLAFVRANLHPEPSALRGPLLLARQERARDGDSGLALGWNVHEIAAGDQTWPLVWRASRSGGFSTFLGFRTDRQQGLVLLASSGSDLARVGLAWLSGTPSPPAPPAPHVAKPGELARYPGLYRLLSGADLIVRERGDALEVQLRGQPPWPLWPVAEDVYASGDGSVGLTFVRNIDTISGLVLRADGRFVGGDRLSTHAPRLSRPTSTMTAQALAQYAGDYVLDRDTMLRIATADGGLVAHFTGAAPIAMRAYAGDRFTDIDGTNGLTFARDERGRIDGVTVDLAGGERKATAATPRATIGAETSVAGAERAGTR